MCRDSYCHQQNAYSEKILTMIARTIVLVFATYILKRALDFARNIQWNRFLFPTISLQILS